MNKLLIGLLIAAAGTGAFFLLRKEKSQTSTFNKEWIIGKWKMQRPVPVTDTTFPLHQYEFQKDGRLLRSLNDSVKADTFHYDWNTANRLVWKNKENSSAKEFNVILLTQDSLQIRGNDSVNVLLTKVK